MQLVREWLDMRSDAKKSTTDKVIMIPDQSSVKEINTNCQFLVKEVFS